MTSPSKLGPGGRALWKSVVENHELDEPQLVQLLEACRSKDRLDRLDEILRGDTETWVRIVGDTETSEIVVDKALSSANATSNLMKQLIATLRLSELPSRGGNTGTNRGVYTKAPKKLTSLERARQARDSA